MDALWLQSVVKKEQGANEAVGVDSMKAKLKSRRHFKIAPVVCLECKRQRGALLRVKSWSVFRAAVHQSPFFD